MHSIKANLIGIITCTLILLELMVGFGTLFLVNIPRAFFPTKSFKKYISRISNKIGDLTVYGLKMILLLMHGNNIQVFDENRFDRNTWYMAMSNHQSWADIFVLLVAAHKRIPLLKFFMKKELRWIPFIYLANKTLNMPFVNRHSKKEIEMNPGLRFKDYQNTLEACKRFMRSPSTIFSYAEGTRNDPIKHKSQNSPYKNLLIPRVGGMATALSAMPEISTLVDYSVVYKSDKRDAWSFLKGEMRDVKILVKEHEIPRHLKNKDYSEDESYRDNFKIWIEEIWIKKDRDMDNLKF